MHATGDHRCLARPRLVRICSMYDSTCSHHHLKADLPCVPLGNGVDCKESEASFIAYEAPRAQKEVRNEVSRTTPSLCDVRDKPITECSACDSGNSLSSQERGVANDGIEAAAFVREHLRKL